MPNRRAQVEAFFAAYARRSGDALKDPPLEDVDGVVNIFAPFFVEAGPKGVRGGPNDESFRQMIPKGFGQYRAVGGRAMRIARLEVTELDALHGMAAVDWEFDYVRNKDGRTGTVSFRNLYLLSFAGGQPKIFAYITPDEEQAMKEHGLI